MARPQSVFLTAAVAMVAGIAIGVIGVTATANSLSPSARDVSTQLEDPAPEPQVYGNR